MGFDAVVIPGSEEPSARVDDRRPARRGEFGVRLAKRTYLLEDCTLTDRSSRGWSTTPTRANAAFERYRGGRYARRAPDRT